GRVVLQSRSGRDLSARFPAVARALARLPVPEAVIDGEIVALDARGVSRFEALGGGDERFAAFDLLWLDGEDLRQRPIEERRDLLESVLSNPPPGVRLAEEVSGDVEEALED